MVLLFVASPRISRDKNEILDIRFATSRNKNQFAYDENVSSDNRPPQRQFPLATFRAFVVAKVAKVLTTRSTMIKSR